MLFVYHFQLVLDSVDFLSTFVILVFGDLGGFSNFLDIRTITKIILKLIV